MTDTATPTRRRTTYRPFVVEVAASRRLTEHFVRLTFRGDDLDRCGDTCLDQRAKLVFADPDQLEVLGARAADPDFEWYAWWLALEEEQRPAMRTYTLRAVRRDVGEVDIDFACHGDEGPASRFALTAQPGDRVVLVGPDADVAESADQGLAWRPGGAREVLLAGDETAVPAVLGILETLDERITGHALLEIPAADDVLDVRTPSGVELTWLVRGDAPVGDRLTTAVTAWEAARSTARQTDADLPAAENDDAEEMVWEEAEGQDASGPYVWLAGESSVVTAIRRRLVHDGGLDRRAMSFMGYWKLGSRG